MFSIDQANWPSFQTRKALLVVDLQNEFLSSTGKLPVTEPADLEAKILELATQFRSSGTVIWLRCLFDKSRLINDGSPESERIITEVPPLRDAGKGRQRAQARLERYKKLVAAQLEQELQDKEASVANVPQEQSEAFLTVQKGERPQYVLPAGPGSMFTQGVLRTMDSQTDLVFTKTHYSAFKDSTLLQTLRGNLITELYICGSLANIGVFATALDAAQHGCAITLVDDCLGYRSKERLQETLRQLLEATGCDDIKSTDLIKDLQRQGKASKPNPHSRPPRKEKPLSTKATPSSQPSATRITPAESTKSNAPASSVPTLSSTPKAPPPSLPAAKTDPLPRHSLEIDDHGDSDEYVPFSLSMPPVRRASEAYGKIPMNKTPSTRQKNASASGTTRPTGVVQSKSAENVKRKEGEGNQLGKPFPTRTTQETNKSSNEKISEDAAGKQSGKQIIASTKSELETENADEASKKLPLRPKADREGTFGSHGAKSEDDLSTPEKDKQSKHLSEGLADLCEGDTSVIHNLLPADIAAEVFEKVRDEVVWQRMSHQGGEVPRLVAVQGQISGDGTIPVYRHPSDESMHLAHFTPTVSKIKGYVEKALGHPVNHALIQFYRDGTDYISEHSDKTLDITPETYIANVSFGAQRTMVFRTKSKSKDGKIALVQDASEATEIAKPTRESCRAALPHNSLCKLGLVSNMRWLHSIRQDKRLPRDKSAAELAFDGARISLTFRSISTFLSADQEKIWGQGATSKTREGAQHVQNGPSEKSEELLKAFGKENQQTEFDWAAVYGKGFDVLHISNSCKLYAPEDEPRCLGLKMLLKQHKVYWVPGKTFSPISFKDKKSTADEVNVVRNSPIKFVDNDFARSTVEGIHATILYIADVYEKGNDVKLMPIDKARQYMRFEQARMLDQKWKQTAFSSEASVAKELESWVTYAEEAAVNDGCIAGSQFGIADAIFWPVLHAIYQRFGKDGLDIKSLQAYYDRVRTKFSEVVAEEQ